MDFINCGFSIHYQWINNNKEKTFLFINSLGTDFRIWDDTVQALKSYGNILRFDKRGHGLSELVVDTHGLEDYANDTLCLMERLSIKKCTIIGLSIGGMIAQAIAYKNAGLIEKLVLCDTRFKIGTPDFWNDRINSVRYGGLSAISAGIMERWFSRSFRQMEPDRVSGYRTMLERTPAMGYIQACEAIRDADLAEVAKLIQVPTLCVVGEEDKSTPPDEVKSLSQLIPGSRFEIIPDSAHIPCVDNPYKLNKVIIDFIS